MYDGFGWRAMINFCLTFLSNRIRKVLQCDSFSFYRQLLFFFFFFFLSSIQLYFSAKLTQYTERLVKNSIDLFMRNNKTSDEKCPFNFPSNIGNALVSMLFTIKCGKCGLSLWMCVCVYVSMCIDRIDLRI